MLEVSVPPSPNWYLNLISDCSDSGQFAYGSKETIVLYNDDKDSFLSIPFAHKGKITSLQFAPVAAGNKLVSSGEDCVVCVWDLDLLQGALANIVHTGSQQTPVASWSHANPNLVVSADTAGYVVSWNLQTNLTCTFHFKQSFTTVSCSPHNRSVVALGTKSGLLCVIDISGKGHVIHKVRGHDVEIVSLAWCPVRENILNPNEKDSCLLASGARDTTIYLWRTASDGLYEKALRLPTAPFPDSGHRGQLPGNSGQHGAHGAWTAVCWPEPGSIVASTQWGELVAYDLLVQFSETEKPAGRLGARNANNWRLLHGKHARGLFSIACRPYSEQSGVEPQTERVIWSVAQDRQIVSCALASGKIVRAMNTFGGPVYSMAISPIDGSRLAVGAADKSIRIWNLTDPNPDSMISLWNKIAGKVYSLAWHPKKEGILAYGTSDGRIGLYDTMSTKPPTVFRLHFTQAVYVLEWGPNINLRGAIGSGDADNPEVEINPKEESSQAKKSEYLLYAIADNQACAFDPTQPSALPVNLKYILRGADAVGQIKLGRKRTGLSWKPDFSLLAVGNEDGSVHFVTPHEATGLRHVRTVLVQAKLIQDLAWHPTSSTNEFLPNYSTWLAVSSNESEIRVVDVSNILISVADIKVDGSELPVPVVAVLKGHHLRVVNIAWNPHVGGQLLSTSYDESAVIWDVKSEQALRHFSGHSGVVLCGLWSPLDPDFVLTGAGDAFVRVWQVSAQKEGPPPSKKKSKPYSRAIHALPDKSFDTSDQRLEKPSPGLKGSSVEVAKSEESMRQDKKKMKEKSLFPVSGPLMNEPTHLLKNLERLIADKGSVSNGEASREEDTGHVPPESDSFGAAAFFGDKEAVAQLMERERSALMGMEHFESAFTLDIWRSKIKDVVEEATKKHMLTDYIVSLSPMASIKTWQNACLAYAEQLCRSSEYLRSAGYYLAVHKVEDAVNMLMENGLSRQAVVIAKSRLATGDPFVKETMEKWAQQKIKEGQSEVAANCLASLGDWTEAADVLMRRRNVPHLCVAAQLASRGGAHEKAASIFLDCLKLNNDEYWDLLTSCLANLNQDHLKLLVMVHQLVLKRFREKLDPEDWLKGTFKNEDHSFEFDFGGKASGNGNVVISKHVQLLLQNLLGSGLSLSRRSEALLTVSINLALAITSAPKCFTDLPEGFTFSEEEDDVHEAVRRMVQAMAALNNYQLRDPNNGHLLLKLCILLAPKGPTHPGSIFSEEPSISPAQKSLRAYLCAGVLSWLMESGSSFIPSKVEVFVDRKPALKARRRFRIKSSGQGDEKTDRSEEKTEQVVPSIHKGGETADETIPPTEQMSDESVLCSAQPTTILLDKKAGVVTQPTIEPAVKSTFETTHETPQSTDTTDKPENPATETADQPAEPSTGNADQLGESTTETIKFVESADQPADRTANHTAESPIETVDQITESADQTGESADRTAESTALLADIAADSVAKSEGYRMSIDSQPAWVHALDLIKRYSHDLFSYTNMRYFSDSVRIKVLLHHETSSALEKLGSSCTQGNNSINPATVEVETKKDDGEKSNKDDAEERKKDDGEERKSDDGEERKNDDGEERKNDDGEERRKNDGEERRKNDGEERKNDDGEETKNDDGEERKKDDGEERKKDDAEERKKDDAEERKKDDAEGICKEKEQGQRGDSQSKEDGEPALTERQRQIKQLQEWFSSFEKDQVEVPNPVVCYTNLNLVLNETLSQVDKKQTETYAEYFRNVWEEAKASNT